MSKLITVAVPCYNSAAYMEKCIQSLLVGGEDVEILIVDDGSQKDDTPAIADRLQKEHPTIIRAIHQENAGQDLVLRIRPAVRRLPRIRRFQGIHGDGFVHHRFLLHNRTLLSMISYTNEEKGGR